MTALRSLPTQVGLLAALQALRLTNGVTMVAVNGLVGLSLADEKWLATLPVTAYVFGGAVWAMPAAAVMRRYGRRFGYTVGSLAAVVGAVIAWWAMSLGSLSLLCFGVFFAGLYNAFGASVRFAAADVADVYRPSFRARAMSLVLAGGIMGGIVGPETAKWSRTWLPTEFSGTYVTLIGFAIASLLIAQLIRLPDGGGAHENDEPVRPLFVLVRQPACLVAILCAALSYGVMNLLMVATPIAMQDHHHAFGDAAFVIEWHVIGMFAPGLITGSLITRFGVLRIIQVGAALNVACVAIALTGVQLMHFLGALFLLGVGWNFMYTGGSTLLTTVYLPSEKNRVQGAMDAAVFSTMIVSSASSGALMHTSGWSALNLIALPFVVLVLVAAWWLDRADQSAA